jgi:hypothetical protein
MIGWIYKKKDLHPQRGGCVIAGLILIWFVLCFVSGIRHRKQEKAESNLTKVTLVTSGEIIKIPNKNFVDSDTTFIGRQNVYKNNTGEELVKYSVKYTEYGDDEYIQPIGLLIKPNEFFYWDSKNENNIMFQEPPSSTTVYYHRYGKSHQLDFTYLTFLDYAKNVEGKVNFRFND